VKSSEFALTVIPAKSGLRKPRHPGESRDPVFSIGSACRIKACPGPRSGVRHAASAALYGTVNLMLLFFCTLFIGMEDAVNSSEGPEER